MIEGYDIKSAEKEYLIENENGYYRACKLAIRPVDFLVEFRDFLLSENFPESDLATQAISEVFELEVIIANEDIAIADERLSIVTTARSGSEAWATNLFSLLRDAGYTKEEIATYISLDDPEFTHEERLREKGLMVYLNSVYEG